MKLSNFFTSIIIFIFLALVRAEDETPPSSEDTSIDEKIANLKLKQCMTLFGDCWVSLRMTKSHLEEDSRMNICFRRTAKFTLCDGITEELVIQTKDEIEAQLKEEWELKLTRKQTPDMNSAIMQIIKRREKEIRRKASKSAPKVSDSPSE